MICQSFQQEIPADFTLELPATGPSRSQAAAELWEATGRAPQIIKVQKDMISVGKYLQMVDFATSISVTRLPYSL